MLCASLAALGTWQLVRLRWKNALIAQVDQRVHAAPAAAPAPADWPQLRKETDYFVNQDAAAVARAGARSAA